MSDRGPFIEIYWRVADEYPEVWDDDHALAWYARLLRGAEAVWPGAADRPEGVPSRTWALLTSTDGLVIPEGPRRYRIRGMDAKRNARRTAASNAARNRWGNANGNAKGNADRIGGNVPRRSDGGGAYGVVSEDSHKSTRTVDNIGPTPADGTDGTDLSVNDGPARNARRTAEGNAESMPKTRPDQNRADSPPTPAERGQDGDDDGMPGGTPRSNGTNPRAVAAREAQRRRDLANDLQMRYLRGELTADQHRQARADAGLPS